MIKKIYFAICCLFVGVVTMVITSLLLLFFIHGVGYLFTGEVFLTKNKIYDWTRTGAFTGAVAGMAIYFYNL